MKKIFLMAIIMLIVSSYSVAQVRAVQYQSQFDENYYNRQLEMQLLRTVENMQIA